ncbi:hypothetical protein [Pseudomonas atagonensis]|uniref:hypothetical protein n=1 Tax=Pseudomonas atagonensis TaxID=2609964 RepID=UPI00140D7BC4|nr:hypothetical protein [Pseudomonas atagonensis]
MATIKIDTRSKFSTNENTFLVEYFGAQLRVTHVTTRLTRILAINFDRYITNGWNDYNRDSDITYIAYTEIKRTAGSTITTTYDALYGKKAVYIQFDREKETLEASLNLFVLNAFEKLKLKVTGTIKGIEATTVPRHRTDVRT